MASNLMMAEERVLWTAQRDARACSRIIACLQKMARSRLASAQAFSLVSPPSAAPSLPAVCFCPAETGSPCRRPPTSPWRLTPSAPPTGTG